MKTWVNPITRAFEFRKFKPLEKVHFTYPFGEGNSQGGIVPPIPPVNQWWLSGGIAATDCVAAYQGKSMPSEASSYVNLNAPGTLGLLVPVGTSAPVWNTATGWNYTFAFDAVLRAFNTQVLDTTVQTMLIRWRYNKATNAFGGNLVGTLGASLFYIGSDPGFFRVAAGGPVSFTPVADVNITETFGFAKDRFFIEGLFNSVIQYGAPATRNAFPICLGSLSVNAGGTTLGTFPPGDMTIESVAFYSAIITDAQVLAVSAAMNLL